MKKFISSSLVIAASFVLFSFTTVSKSQGVYDTVSGNIEFNAGLAGSFTQYNTSGTDKDVKWKDWHKNWTSIEAQDNLISISDELATLDINN